METVKYEALVNPIILQSESASLLLMQNEIFAESRWSKERLHDFFFDKKRMPILVKLKINGSLAGFALGRKLQQKNTFNLELVAVHPKYGGNGYGQELIKKFINTVFKKTNAKKIILHFRDGKKLENFYTKVGFANHAIVGEYKNGEPKHYMECNKNVMLMKDNISYE